ncbi:MAG: epimerase [Rhodobacteraceae bacterium]|nr:epimerase [Paracoccaceae bacterium]
MTQTVLILGASGKIGRASAKAFGEAGWKVRSYQRGTDMTQAALGADVIVNGLNPPAYHDWKTIIPQITTQVIAAANASGATVIIPGNVYNFGNYGGVWDENTPQRPTTRKGKIRVEMEQRYRQSGVSTIILRAGNFITQTPSDDVMGAVFLRQIKTGKLSHPGAPDIPQAYAYLPDWARAAVALAERRDQLQRFEDIPFPGHTFTVLDLKAALEDRLSRDLRLSGFPWGVMLLASPFWELAREMLEMRGLWNTPHQLGAAKFHEILPDFQPTPQKHVLIAGLGHQIDPNQTVGANGIPVGA